MMFYDDPGDVWPIPFPGTRSIQFRWRYAFHCCFAACRYAVTRIDAASSALRYIGDLLMMKWLKIIPHWLKAIVVLEVLSRWYHCPWWYCCCVVFVLLFPLMMTVVLFYGTCLEQWKVTPKPIWWPCDLCYQAVITYHSWYRPIPDLMEAGDPTHSQWCSSELMIIFILVMWLLHLLHLHSAHWWPLSIFTVFSESGTHCCICWPTVLTYICVIVILTVTCCLAGTWNYRLQTYYWYAFFIFHSYLLYFRLVHHHSCMMLTLFIVW